MLQKLTHQLTTLKSKEGNLKKELESVRDEISKTNGQMTIVRWKREVAKCTGPILFRLAKIPEKMTTLRSSADRKLCSVNAINAINAIGDKFKHYAFPLSSGDDCLGCNKRQRLNSKDLGRLIVEYGTFTDGFWEQAWLTNQRKPETIISITPLKKQKIVNGVLKEVDVCAFDGTTKMVDVRVKKEYMRFRFVNTLNELQNVTEFFPLREGNVSDEKKNVIDFLNSYEFICRDCAALLMFTALQSKETKDLFSSASFESFDDETSQLWNFDNGTDHPTLEELRKCLSIDPLSRFTNAGADI